MKAAVLNSIQGHFDIELDEPRGREVLVKVKASGLCHSDMHLAEHDYGIPLPAVLGHELAGIVEGIGPDVREFAVGDHVVASLIQFCGHCEACLDGRTYQCGNRDETLRRPGEPARLTRRGLPLTNGFGTSAFAEYSLVHENQLAKVPREIPFAQAAVLGCGCVTGAGAAINTANVRSGDTVAVIGVGGVGLNVISGARLADAQRIIAIDVHADKESLARKFGATDFVNAQESDAVKTVIELTGGGVVHAFEVIGLTETSHQAIKMVRLGGGAYLIGMHKLESRLELDVTGDLLRRQVTVRGVYMGSSNIKHDIPMYANLYLQGRFNLDDLVSREIPLSQINKAYAELKSGKIARTVITSF